MNGAAVIRPPSSAVGDYLKAIWELAGAEAASTKDVADRLSISPASVSNMFVRLQEMGFVEYERYRGASLTGQGREEALRLVRRHRLIETFLLEHLGYSWSEVHEEAERLEHAVSDAFTERLAELLGHPERDPHGDLIPAADGTLAPEEGTVPLSEVAPGDTVRVARVGHQDASQLAYLWEHELVPGRVLNVREVRALDGVVTVEDEGGYALALGGPLAGGIFVRGA
jgi:DtxR family transcriptional regulator, Mn-dependent transcriptional regulator